MARNIAKKIEEKRVEYIVNSVNDNTPMGINLKESFETKFGKKVKRFENIGGKLKELPKWYFPGFITVYSAIINLLNKFHDIGLGHNRLEQLYYFLILS